MRENLFVCRNDLRLPDIIYPAGYTHHYDAEAVFSSAGQAPGVI